PLDDLRLIVRIPQDHDARRARNKLLEELHPLAGHVSGERAHASHVAAGMRKARDQAAADRVSGKSHYDRDFVCCLLGSADRRLAANHQDINRQLHEFGCEGWETIKMTFGIAVFHLEMTLLDIAEVAHSEQKLTAQVCFYRVGQQSSLEVTQLEDFRLLRMRYDRQADQCGAEQRDEIASSHGSSRQPRDGPSARPECCRSSG